MQQLNLLNQQQINWVEEHSYIFNGVNRTMTKDIVHQLFSIYSWVTGKNQRPTGCSRCIVSAKAAVWAAYTKTKESNDD